MENKITEFGNFQTVGQCPAGYIEQRIKHKNWYGEIVDSGWKLCSPTNLKVEEEIDPKYKIRDKNEFIVQRFR